MSRYIKQKRGQMLNAFYKNHIGGTIWELYWQAGFHKALEVKVFPELVIQ